MAGKEFEFKTAQELIKCLEEHKIFWQGQKVTAFYRDMLLNKWTDGAIVFVLGEYSIVINYYFLSSIYGQIVDTQTFLSDMENECWEKYSYYTLAPDERCFFVNQAIQKIEIGRFSREFEINASTGETRPQGGDYFGEILITFDSGRVLRIVAEDAEFDGYMDIEEVPQNEKEHWIKKCGYRECLTEII